VAPEKLYIAPIPANYMFSVAHTLSNRDPEHLKSLNRILNSANIILPTQPTLKIQAKHLLINTEFQKIVTQNIGQQSSKIMPMRRILRKLNSTEHIGDKRRENPQKVNQQSNPSS